MLNRGSWLVLGTLFTIACAPQPARIDFGGENSLTFHSASASRRVDVVVIDGEGRPIQKPSLRWDTMDPSIATVSDDGFITPHAQGRTQIIARAGLVDRVLPVTVRYYSELRLPSEAITIGKGAETKLEAEVIDAEGEVVGTAQIAWSVTDREVAEIDRFGALLGRSPGTAVAIGRAAHLAAQIEVEVVDQLDPAI